MELPGSTPLLRAAGVVAGDSVRSGGRIEPHHLERSGNADTHLQDIPEIRAARWLVRARLVGLIGD